MSTDSAFAISYSGRFTKPSSHEFGTVLDKNGIVYFRAAVDDEWEEMYSPKIFLFRDTSSDKCYVVDSYKKKITQTIPKGQVIDATTRLVYEIDKSTKEWVPVVNLNPVIAPVVKIYPYTPDEDIMIDIVGDSPVLSIGSEVSKVDFKTGIVSCKDVHDGGVLVYESSTQVSKMLVVGVFKEIKVPQFSTLKGTVKDRWDTDVWRSTKERFYDIRVNMIVESGKLEEFNLYAEDRLLMSGNTQAIMYSDIVSFSGMLKISSTGNYDYTIKVTVLPI